MAIVTDRNFADFAIFCERTFPLLYWIYKEVPSKSVGNYFSSCHEFFISCAEYFPEPEIYGLFRPVDFFFRASSSFPGLDPQTWVENVNLYCRQKMGAAHSTLYSYMKNRLPNSNQWKSFIAESNPHPEVEPKMVNIDDYNDIGTLISVFQQHFQYLAENPEIEISDSERYVAEFMMLVCHYLFEQLGGGSKFSHLPSTITSKMANILAIPYKTYLNIEIPDVSNIWILSNCSAFLSVFNQNAR